MRRFRPRNAALALPWLLTACATGPQPAPPPADDCVLLCALQRALFGTPEPPPSVEVAPNLPSVRPHPKAAPRRANRARQQPKRQAPPSTSRETSIVPQTSKPARSQAATVAPPSPPPAPVVEAPPPPLPGQPHSLSQTIPGSVGIMPPSWQP